MTNENAKSVDLIAFSDKGYEVYAVCNLHRDLYPDNHVRGTVEVNGPWQCDNCPEDYPPATGTVYVMSEIGI